MITLYGSGPMFGLPDPSPFVVKAETLLKMSGVPYEKALMSFRKAPKGKIPYIEDKGHILGDSHFIRRHLERDYKIDFSGGYDERICAAGWALERMMEEHLYFLNVHSRWMDDGNFEKGPRQFFDRAPAPIRPVVRTVIRRKVRKMLHGQGLGRHSEDERLELAQRDIDCVETLLGDNRYIFGAKPCATDATAFPFLFSAAAPYFKSQIGDDIRTRPRLVAYLCRMQAEYFPDLKHAAA
jgi:glutathione S-transferase